jgi:predicted 3-demethylubiquinone-9 3-methyltransferase (glyoxalase superfamily)
MPAITPFLWFDTQAEDAARFYTSVFPNSRIMDVVRYGAAGPGPTGSVMTVHFELDGREFVALNGGPAYYGFNLAVSFVIDCKTPEEVDYYWAALTEGGREDQCGWLQDRFGLAWQVVPEGLPALLGDPDPERAQRAMQAMMGMKKLDIRAMELAAQGANGAPS